MATSAPHIQASSWADLLAETASHQADPIGTLVLQHRGLRHQQKISGTEGRQLFRAFVGAKALA